MNKTTFTNKSKLFLNFNDGWVFHKIFLHVVSARVCKRVLLALPSCPFFTYMLRKQLFKNLWKALHCELHTNSINHFFLYFQPILYTTQTGQKPFYDLHYLSEVGGFLEKNSCVKKKRKTFDNCCLQSSL